MKTQTRKSVRQPQKFDWILILIVVAIAVSSILALYAAVPLMPKYINPNSVIMRQIIFYFAGIVVVGVLMYLGNENLDAFAKIGYKILLVMLLYLFASSMYSRIAGRYLPFASPVNGALSWFDFPAIGTFQPSEFMKIVLIIITANIINKHNEEKQRDNFGSDIQLFIEIGKWALPPLILILIQPDTGIFLVTAFTLLVMVLCSGIRREWIIAIGAIVIIALIGFLLLVFVFPDTLNSFFAGSGDYKVGRIYGWLYPEESSNGEGLQLYTALLGMGSAGINGYSLGSTIINIPEAQTDFIFAVIGIYYGLIGTLVVLGLCLAFDARLFVIARRSKNHVEKLMIIGFIAMILIQQIENMGMVIGLFPITGITLPMISAGGSSLLSYMIVVGICMNTSLKAKKLSDYVYD